MTSETSIKVTSNFSREEFSRFVHKNPKASIFQTPEMAEVYKRNIGCSPLTLAAIDENTGEIVASLVAKKLNEKRGFLSSFSTHLTIRGGPIFAPKEEGIKAIVPLLHYYNKIIEKEALYSRIYPLVDISEAIFSIENAGYVFGDWQNFLINLNKPIDEIWMQLKKSRRYGINKAKKRGVHIEEIKDKELIPIFYDLLQETYKKRKALLEDISNFEAVWKILVPKNMAKFLMAKCNGKYIAAMLILLYKDVVYNWYAGSSMKRDDLLLCPNDLVVWHGIELGYKNGFRIFDLGGAGKPNDKAGFIRFKKEFGGELVNYGRYTKIHQPRKLQFSLKMFEIYKRLFIR
jgi:lipid II:glycine glycyltransferase (peptidoglycan interpeptide bridge formation enzyme)